MRDKYDTPFAKTVSAVGEGSIYSVLLPNGTPAIPLQPTVTNEDGSETARSIAGATDFETLIDGVYAQIAWKLTTTLTTAGGILAPTK